MHQEGRAQLTEYANVDVARGTHRTHEGSVLALKDGGVAGNSAFDRLFEDHVGLVQAALRSRRGVVVNLDRQRRSCRDRTAAGYRGAREGTGRDGHRDRRGAGCRGGGRRAGMVRDRR
jgi:hypothetical protein